MSDPNKMNSNNDAEPTAKTGWEDVADYAPENKIVNKIDQKAVSRNIAERDTRDEYLGNEINKDKLAAALEAAGNNEYEIAKRKGIVEAKHTRDLNIRESGGILKIQEEAKAAKNEAEQKLFDTAKGRRNVHDYMRSHGGENSNAAFMNLMSNFSYGMSAETTQNVISAFQDSNNKMSKLQNKHDNPGLFTKLSNKIPFINSRRNKSYEDKMNSLSQTRESAKTFVGEYTVKNQK